MNAGVRRPSRSALISLVLLVASVGALLSGILAMTGAGAESTFSAIAIALGGLGSIIFLFTLINFVWGMRVFDAIRRGENVITRWTVPADAFDRFRENEVGHVANGHPNDYKLPRRTPPEGIEVIFAADGVIVGDTFFGLATTGLSHFRQVGIVPGNPLCIGFQTALVTGRQRSSGTPAFSTVLGVLRIPVANSAHPEAKAVIDHYIAALAGQVIVKPDFWPRRIRWGLWAAVVSSIVSATGFGLEAVDADVGRLSVILAVSGAVAAIGGLLLAFLAWSFASRQRRGRRNDGTPA
jgi:hypothetical protein